MRGIVESKYKILYQQLMLLEEALMHISDIKVEEDVKLYRSRLEQIYSDYKTNFDLIATAVSNFDRHEKMIKRLLIVYKKSVKNPGTNQSNNFTIDVKLLRSKLVNVSLITEDKKTTL